MLPGCLLPQSAEPATIRCDSGWRVRSRVCCATRWCCVLLGSQGFLATPKRFAGRSNVVVFGLHLCAAIGCPSRVHRGATGDRRQFGGQRIHHLRTCDGWISRLLGPDPFPPQVPTDTPLPFTISTPQLSFGLETACEVNNRQGTCTGAWLDPRGYGAGGPFVPFAVPKPPYDMLQIDLSDGWLLNGPWRIGFTCAISRTPDRNDVYCWGINRNGSLGDDTDDNHDVPTKVLF